jgi:mannitol/fructose-specific phosphotransferase system IIA component (Ntr-type)
MIARLVGSAALLPQLAAKNKDAALKELLQAAQDAAGLPAKVGKSLAKKLHDREAIGSTGLGNSVAVPHVKSDDVDRVTLVVARAAGGLEWQAIDGKPVSILFLLVSPASEPEQHLQCLRWISTLARNADFRRFLLDAVDADAMRDLLREMAPGASA